MALALLLLATTTACSRSRRVQPQATPAESPPAAVDPARGEPVAISDPSDEGVPAARSGGRESEWATLETRIYFDFDQSNLSAQSRDALTAKLSVLMANPDIQIRIAGHADERGSDEYNLALGLERAAAAKRFLVQRGVSADRVSTVSMGEEHPVCTVSNEGCWWQNRRDDFVVTSAVRPRP
jgi:peptidoglycan-associated lipoprotein